MSPTYRSILHAVLPLLVSAALALTVSAQPTPEKASPGSGPVILPAPAGTMGPPATMMSPVAAGIITQDEFTKFTAFQQKLNDDPAIKELSAKIAERSKELKQLQAEIRALREKLVAADPEIKAIRDKLMSAGRPRPGSGPGPMPMPAKGP